MGLISRVSSRTYSLEKSYLTLKIPCSPDDFQPSPNDHWPPSALDHSPPECQPLPKFDQPYSTPPCKKGPLPKSHSEPSVSNQKLWKKLNNELTPFCYVMTKSTPKL